MFILDLISFITSIGQGEPAITPGEVWNKQRQLMRGDESAGGGEHKTADLNIQRREADDGHGASKVEY